MMASRFTPLLFPTHGHVVFMLTGLFGGIGSVDYLVAPNYGGKGAPFSSAIDVNASLYSLGWCNYEAGTDLISVEAIFLSFCSAACSSASDALRRVTTSGAPIRCAKLMAVRYPAIS